MIPVDGKNQNIAFQHYRERIYEARSEIIALASLGNREEKY